MSAQIDQVENDSSMLDIKSSVTLRKKHIHNPFIAYLNINSLRNKIHDIRTMMSEMSPEILTISETKLDVSFPDAQFKIDGYQSLRKDRNKYGGGLITFIKTGIPYKRVPKIEPQNLEVICIELTFGKRKWGYVTVYRPPVENPKYFFEDLSKCVEQITNLYDHVIVTGDININTKDETSPGFQAYENFLDTFGLKNLIKHDTCFTNKNKKHVSTSLDVFLTNSANSFFNSHTVSTGISDCHALVGSLLRATYRRSEPLEIEYRNYKKLYQQFEPFLNDIKNIEIPAKYQSDPNQYYDAYTKTFENILNYHAPLKKKKVRGNDGGFANKELRKSWYKRSMLRNIYNKNRNDENWNNFKKQRNICTTLKRKAKRTFFIEKTKDREGFWKIFGPYLSNKGHHSKEDYIISKDGALINDKKSVANLFNDHYIHIIENTTGEKLNIFPFDPLKDPVDQILETYKSHPSILQIKEKMRQCPDYKIFEIPQSTEGDIYNIIVKLNAKAAQGYDKIHPKILKLCANEIAGPISKIINSSLQSGTFVDKAKISLCTPIYKNPPNGSRQQITLYRPLNICTSFSKILERYNLNSMLEYTNKILSKHISAYRKGYNCQHVLLKLTEDWRKYMDENKIIGGLLMDLSKAFDCLPHELLIAKLEAYGFEKKTLSSFLSYLKNRKQAVNINGILSDFLEILSGVPQGSILGPILFNIFLNDFIYDMESTPTDNYNFADDNTLSACAENMEELKLKLEEGASKALKWLVSNKMIANPDKFKVIVLKKPSINVEDIIVNVGNQEIKPSSSVKLLGLNIDNKLNFKKHIKEISSKAGAKLNAIKRLGLYLNKAERKLLIDAHVTSQLRYSSTVWHMCGLTEIHKLERLHERCVRFIYQDHVNSYFDILNENNVTTLYGERTRAMCCETFKTINGLNAEYMKDIFEERQSKYPSRNPENLYVPKANQVTYGYKSYRIQGPKIWNFLPSEIKEIKSFDVFKKNIKDLTMPFCSCLNCLTLQIQMGKTSILVENMFRNTIETQ